MQLAVAEQSMATNETDGYPNERSTMLLRRSAAVRARAGQADGGPDGSDVFDLPQVAGRGRTTGRATVGILCRSFDRRAAPVRKRWAGTPLPDGRGSGNQLSGSWPWARYSSS